MRRTGAKLISLVFLSRATGPPGPAFWCVLAVVVYHMAQLFFILKSLAGAKRHAIQRFIRDRNRKPRLFAKRKVQFAQKRAAPG